MTVMCFLDTNILLYAAKKTRTDAAKREQAAEIIAASDFGISTQVLQEFYVNVTRKGAPPMSAAVALEWIEQLAHYPCAITDHKLIKIAIEKSERFQISYWDSAVLVAAETLDAPIIYTENLNHEQHYGSVQVINPFSHMN